MLLIPERLGALRSAFGSVLGVGLTSGLTCPSFRPLKILPASVASLAASPRVIPNTAGLNEIPSAVRRLKNIRAADCASASEELFNASLTYLTSFEVFILLSRLFIC
ncbi:hypothetical protein CJ20_211 [Escherichia phage CJ20]|nr:hypothetical protein CJ20_211 [Escherichia phage CJ20]